MFSQAVRHTGELERIIALPRRTADSALKYAEELTTLLKTSNGSMTLRKHQALTLHDIFTNRGAFCGVETGGGKTLISGLAARVLDAKRPMLMQPAALIQKTALELKELRKHWLIPTNIRLFSYEMLGRDEYALELEIYNPDLLILDETHKAKNVNAARTRRIERQKQKHPEMVVVALTGTMMRTSIHDYEHLLEWCLGKEALPLPKTQHERDEWAFALDDKVDDLRRYEPGALLELADAMGIDKNLPALQRARLGYQKRLTETPGIVITVGEGEKVDAEIKINAIKYDMAPITDQHFEKLRATMVTPDDWQLMEAVEVWMHTRQLALGFHSLWEPRPPDEWRLARRNWNAFVRDALSNSRTLDSPLQVANACDMGKLSSAVLDVWRRIEPTFTPNVVAAWHDDSALKVVVEWMKTPGIVWTEHVPFARRLAEMTGAKYYGAKGLSDDGEFIDNADPTKAIIVSIDANKEGRNLQWKWHRNLVVSPPHGADVWQQFIARTHRPGQRNTVIVDVLLGCAEHARAWRQAISSAKLIRDTTGAEQKILQAKVKWPSAYAIERFKGPRWQQPVTEAFEIPLAA